MGITCTYCGGAQLVQGFIEDAGQSSQGYLRLIEGPLERGLFGGAKRMGKSRATIHAYVCASCSHVELFATREP